MAHSFSIPRNKMIPITHARRNLGELVKRLEEEKELYLVKDGKIAAKLSLPEEVKQTRWEKAVDEAFGAWKETDLDDDELWEEILVTERIQGTMKRELIPDMDLQIAATCMAQDLVLVTLDTRHFPKVPNLKIYT